MSHKSYMVWTGQRATLTKETGLFDFNVALLVEAQLRAVIWGAVIIDGCFVSDQGGAQLMGVLNSTTATMRWGVNLPNLSVAVVPMTLMTTLSVTATLILMLPATL